MLYMCRAHCKGHVNMHYSGEWLIILYVYHYLEGLVMMLAPCCRNLQVWVSSCRKVNRCYTHEGSYVKLHLLCITSIYLEPKWYLCLLRASSLCSTPSKRIKASPFLRPWEFKQNAMPPLQDNIGVLSVCFSRRDRGWPQCKINCEYKHSILHDLDTLNGHHYSWTSEWLE